MKHQLIVLVMENEMSSYKVVEKFVSINGEGKKAGQLSVFIRFKGCNLNCEYCDTKWANKADAVHQDMSAEDIYRYIQKTKVKNITLTGGEPLLQPQIEDLLLLLGADEELYIEIETNGSVDISRYQQISPRVTYTLDYKLSASKMENQMYMDNYTYVRAVDTVKFVVANIEDLDKTRDIIDRYLSKKQCGIYISPVYKAIEPADIVEYMIENKMNNVNVQLQLHKYIWDPNARGV